MIEVDDKAYTLNLNNVHMPDKPQRKTKATNHLSGYNKMWRPVIQMDEDGNRLHWYQSSAHAARKLGLKERNIRSVCYGDRQHCGGFRWKFDENFL